MYDVIGDIHGCDQELDSLLSKLGYRWENGSLIHPTNRKLVFVGDLTDRGPNSVKVMELVSRLVKENNAFYAPGNHCDKLYRYLIGRKVEITHGLETTVAELNQLDRKRFNSVKRNFIHLYESAPLYVTLNEGKLIVAHAGIRGDYIGRDDKKVKTFVLYGDITGEKHPDGSPVRRDWAKQFNHKTAFVVYGHTPVEEPRKINNTINIDTGCVFGGKLTAFCYPEMTTVSVPSNQPYVKEKFRIFDE